MPFLAPPWGQPWGHGTGRSRGLLGDAAGWRQGPRSCGGPALGPRPRPCARQRLSSCLAQLRAVFVCRCCGGRSCPPCACAPAPWVRPGTCPRGSTGGWAAGEASGPRGLPSRQGSPGRPSPRCPRSNVHSPSSVPPRPGWEGGRGAEGPPQPPHSGPGPCPAAPALPAESPLTMALLPSAPLHGGAHTGSGPPMLTVVLSPHSLMHSPLLPSAPDASLEADRWARGKLPPIKASPCVPSLGEGAQRRDPAPGEFGACLSRGRGGLVRLHGDETPTPAREIRLTGKQPRAWGLSHTCSLEGLPPDPRGGKPCPRGTQDCWQRSPRVCPGGAGRPAPWQQRGPS